LPKKFIDLIESDYLKKSIQKYKEVLPTCQIVDEPESDEGKKVIAAFIAGYAKLRDWSSNKDHRKAVSDALEPFLKTETIDKEHITKQDKLSSEPIISSQAKNNQ